MRRRERERDHIFVQTNGCWQFDTRGKSRLGDLSASACGFVKALKEAFVVCVGKQCAECLGRVVLKFLQLSR